MSSCILSEFDKYKRLVISKMPNIKKLKRLNLKLLEEIINGYEAIFGQVEVQKLFNKGQLKIYSFEQNEFKDLDFVGANFLCYFTFKVKV